MNLGLSFEKGGKSKRVVEAEGEGREREMMLVYTRFIPASFYVLEASGNFAFLLPRSWETGGLRGGRGGGRGGGSIIQGVNSVGISISKVEFDFNFVNVYMFLRLPMYCMYGRHHTKSRVDKLTLVMDVQ